MTAVKALMQKEKLKTMEEVQSYFEKRLEKIVESKGKNLWAGMKYWKVVLLQVQR
jgi:N-acetyl-beta-hexosaminidase